MSTNRVTIVENRLDTYLATAEEAPARLAPSASLRSCTTLTAGQAVALFEDQVLSRCLDVTARELKKTSESYYTISSAGHEQNAIVGALLRTTDPAFLHYRSGAFMMARWRQHPGSTPLFNTLLSMCASSEDPISGGRHKVWGCKEVWVPPQTSTIASHLPKAMGMAWALPRARRMQVDTHLPIDSVVLASFGDASANHATALAGINSARYAKRRGNPIPLLLLCEDNRRGISVATPRRWLREFYSNVPHMRYFEARGQMDEIWNTARLAIQTCRTEKIPVFLHLRCVRLWGHAGSDIETAYRSLGEIETVESKDPLLRNARQLVETGAATPRELAAILSDTRERVAGAAREASARPKLTSFPQVVARLAPYDETVCRASATAAIDPEVRADGFGKKLPEQARSDTRRTMAALINAALRDEMIRRPETILFGEDVGRKGGVYGVTRGLQEHFGEARVFDTLLDETSILGIAQGAAHAGLLPIPEIQYLAYIHNALDQLRGEAASLSFFSNGQFQNPMVVRVAGLAYQKGFGGHFHNDNSIGALRDIPGLIIATPSNGNDAVRLLRGSLAMAHEHGRVVCFLEPIALYHKRDLHEEGDGGWLCDYPAPDGDRASALLPGEVGVHGADGCDYLIVSYANGYRLSLQAAKRVAEETGQKARVIDLRWLNPLPFAAVREHADACGRVLFVDECRETGGGVAEALIAHLAESDFRGKLRSLRAKDCFVPLGSAAGAVLISHENIVDSIHALLGKSGR